MVILIDVYEKIPLFDNDIPIKIGHQYYQVNVKQKHLKLGDTLYSQDYSVESMENIIGIQFKRLSDFYQSVGRNHDNFMANAEAFKKHVKNPFMIIPSLSQILQGCNHWNVNKAKRRTSTTTMVKDYQIVGTLVRIAEMGIKIRYATNSQSAAKYIFELFQYVYINAPK